MSRVTSNVGPAQAWSDRRLAAVVFGLLFPLFLGTAAWRLPYHIDPLTNVYTAAAIGQTGSPILDEHQALATPGAFRVLGWVVPSPRGPVSQYPPGTALFAAPAYALAGDGEVQDMSGSNDPALAPVKVRVPPLWPAALMACLASAVAATALALSVHGAVGSRWALATAVMMSAGTGLWLNGAHELWQHGVSSMWISIGLLAASRGSWLGSGVAFGAGILTRPTVAVVSACLGCWTGWRQRDWRPVALHGLGAGIGLGALLAYNYWLWGELTLTGGYSSAFTERITTAEMGWYARNVLGGFFSLDRGLLAWSPFLIVAVGGLPRTWQALPRWVSGAFLGGVFLLLVQFRLNRYSGGEGFFSYRYPLEAVMAAAPALAIAARGVWQRGDGWQRALLYSAAISVALHGAALLVELRI